MVLLKSSSIGPSQSRRNQREREREREQRREISEPNLLTDLNGIFIERRSNYTIFLRIIYMKRKTKSYSNQNACLESKA